MNAQCAPAARRQRAQGRLAVEFEATGDGAGRLSRLGQRGCLRARFPRPQDAGWIEAVTLNVSGGIASGDELATEIRVGAGAKACVAGQAAERIYDSGGGPPARIATRIDVAAGAALDWLPQETIFYDGFSVERALTVELAEDARFVGVDMQAFGRRGMGETIRDGRWRDTTRVSRGGKLLLADRIRLDGDFEGALAGAATAGGASAIATILFAAPDAPGRLDAVRERLHDLGPAAGATTVEGIVVARTLAKSLHELRRTAASVLEILRDGRALPRVWQV
ncbi:MAG: urease accessory protein UreD [Hyphomicrobiales bacterium]|nr:urease accessory protein UreD [Hyphomicrobiales bacterium]MDE2017714.1 urease accessory protein UreD [Hyphomicrobiales bacterium]